MKTVFSFLLLLISALPSMAAPQPSKYPLRVFIMTSRWQGAGAVKHGTAKGNVEDAGVMSAFDFTYDCSVPFLALGMNRAYPGAWKEKGSVLALLLTHVQAPDSKSECELHATPVKGLYAEKGGRLVSVSPEEFKDFQEDIEKEEQLEIKRTGENYPLRAVLLQADWTSAGNMRMGVGKGNVTEGGKKRGFLFRAKCPAPTLQNIASAEYWAKWAQTDKNLIIAAPPTGDADTAYCIIATTMQPHPFKLGADGKVVPDTSSTSPTATPKPNKKQQHK